MKCSGKFPNASELAQFEGSGPNGFVDGTRIEMKPSVEAGFERRLVREALATQTVDKVCLAMLRLEHRVASIRIQTGRSRTHRRSDQHGLAPLACARRVCLLRMIRHENHNMTESETYLELALRTSSHLDDASLPTVREVLVAKDLCAALLVAKVDLAVDNELPDLSKLHERVCALFGFRLHQHAQSPSERDDSLVCHC